MAETFAVTQAFGTDVPDVVMEQAREAALRDWWDRARTEGTPVGEPIIERFDPASIGGELLNFPFVDEDGVEHESPPMSAWRVTGQVDRHDRTP